MKTNCDAEQHINAVVKAESLQCLTNIIKPRSLLESDSAPAAAVSKCIQSEDVVLILQTTALLYSVAERLD